MAQTPLYEYDTLAVLVNELKTISGDLSRIAWYGAQPFAFAQPVLDEKDDPVIQCWDGHPDGRYFYSDAAYAVGVSPQGTLLRELRGMEPMVFSSLFRQYESVTGIDLVGNSVNLSPEGTLPPTWESPVQEISELRHVRMQASEIFAPVHGKIMVFAGLR